MFGAMWSEHCAYKHSRAPAAVLPSSGARVLTRWAGERRRDRHRRRAVRGLQGGVAQPPQSHRAVPGRRHRRGRHHARHLTMGARPIALLDSLRFGPLSDRTTATCSAGWWRASPATATASASPTWRRGLPSPRLQRQPPRQRHVRGAGAPRRHDLGGARRASATRCMLVGAATGRDGIRGDGSPPRRSTRSASGARRCRSATRSWRSC